MALPGSQNPFSRKQMQARFGRLERAKGERWKRPWGADRKMDPENNEGPRLDLFSQERNGSKEPACFLHSPAKP